MNTWTATYRIIKQKPLLFLVNGLIWGVLHSSWILPGFVAKAVFDYLTDNSVLDFSFWGLIALFVGIGLGRVITLFIGIGTYTPWNALIRGVLSLNMMKHILRRPGADALPNSPGEAVSRFRGDVDRALYFVGDWMVDLYGFALGAFIALFVMFRINSRIALAVVVPALIVMVINNLMRKKLEIYRDAQRKAAGRVTGFIGEMFGAVQAVKVADGLAGIQRHFGELNEKRRTAALKDSLAGELLNTSFHTTVEISTGIILLLAGQTISDGSFTVGDFALFVSSLFPITEGLTYIGQLFAVQKQTDVSISRMERLLQDAPKGALVEDVEVCLDGEFATVPAIPKQTHHRLHHLKTHNLTYLYPGTERGIQNINLSLPCGSFTVVTGRIGSGKTTLLRVLLGLLPLDEGQVLWNNEAISDLANFFIPPRAAYTGQVPRLFSDTLQSNVLLGMPAITDIHPALHAAVMEQDLVSLEAGLETMVGPRGVKLSGGQIQRTSAARMFAREPELYVFDDLSSALDVKTEQTLWHRMFDRTDRMNGNRPTCLVVSHRRAALQRADHIIVMNDGQVDDEGSLDDLLLRSPEMQRLWHRDRS